MEEHPYHRNGFQFLNHEKATLVSILYYTFAVFGKLSHFVIFGQVASRAMNTKNLCYRHLYSKLIVYCKVRLKALLQQGISELD